MDINITLIGQMITFTIFVAFTVIFVWPPLNKAMQERRDKISDGLSSAKLAKKNLDDSYLQSKKVIDNAKKRAKIIIEQASVNVLKIQDDSKTSMLVHAERMRKSLDLELEAQRKSLMYDLRKDFVNVISLAIEKLINKKIDFTDVEMQIIKDISSKV